MNILFYMAATIAVISTAMVLTRFNAVHSLLYLIVSLLSISVVFFVIGAPFIAILEVIIYAGAIMVLFVFVIMMLNLGPQSAEQERLWLKPGMFFGPALLSAILLVEFLYVLHHDKVVLPGTHLVEPRELSLALYGKYSLIVEMASMLLLAGLVGAHYLGRRDSAAPVPAPGHRLAPRGLAAKPDASAQ